ncbi:MAG: acetylxylan esterase [Planctomycetaceae bacterium]|nr:MAG: acetylxylan esterase [Planctomycetaceae bacterium]
MSRALPCRSSQFQAGWSVSDEVGWLAFIVLSTLLLVASSIASDLRVLPEGRLPDDRRLQPLKDLDGYFPFQPPADLDAWQHRSEQIRRQVLVSQGLWPMPEKTPLNAVIHGRIKQPGYTIEKVYFESFPGFYVTGNLYRPEKVSGRAPGILSPHGHWPNGRFYDAGEASVLREIVQGAERFEDGGRSPMQARCVQLARMGCVVFHYDMIGYADCQQISYEIAHRFAKQRPDMNRAEGWGFYSPQAESNLQSVMGLQTWNSIRALDFLESLPDVDPQRLGATGASGGGTQTFLLAAIDPRLAVSFPAVMVSTAMQGGCTCENACLLRIGTGNVEFAALFAPQPQALTGADDWTREMETKGFPELKQLYEMFQAAEKVRLHPLVWFRHNFNYVNRAVMYEWMNQHFELGLPSPIVEGPYQRLTPDELTVWNADHPKPQGGDQFERDLLRAWKADSDRQLDALLPRDPADGDRFERVIGGAVQTLIGRGLPSPEDVEFESVERRERDGWVQTNGLLNHRPAGEQLPVVLLEPDATANRMVVWLSAEGKSGLFEHSGELHPAVAELLGSGVTVLGGDLLYQGEFLPTEETLQQTPRVKNPREAAAYTFGYNHTVFASRVHDVLTLIAFARQRSPDQQVDLAGLHGSGPWASVALSVAGDAVDKAVLDTQRFRFAAIDDIHSPDFLPGGAKYFDLPGMLTLARSRIWLAGESEQTVPVLVQAWQATDRRDRLTIHDGPDDQILPQAVRWLLD